MEGVPLSVNLYPQFDPRGLDPDHIRWSRIHFDSMREGADWLIPRSGLVFRKKEGTLVLVEGQNEVEYRVISAHFEAAGIPVIRHIPASGPIQPVDSKRRRGS